jgi:Holliday junction resolvase-like predicted endonuclease
VPTQDQQHPVVCRALRKAGWTIVKEQVSLAIGNEQEITRRLYIDVLARSNHGQIVLIEVKGIASSPVHELMELIGQYLVYRAALHYLADATPLYVAIPVVTYQTIVEHLLGQTVMQEMLKTPIPFVLYDPDKEELVRWIPPL